MHHRFIGVAPVTVKGMRSATLPKLEHRPPRGSLRRLYRAARSRLSSFHWIVAPLAAIGRQYQRHRNPDRDRYPEQHGLLVDVVHGVLRCQKNAPS